MRYIDVFNGDADGICALHQLRLAQPAESELITGVKRDIELLKQVSAGAGDEVTVLDISLDRNRASLVDLLDRGARVRYFDHHGAHDIPLHPGLDAHIDQSPQVCTSILVDRALEGRFRIWAVVAAFGDNLTSVAARMAGSLDLSEFQIGALRSLGENLNYNSYGEAEADLLIPPRDLYRMLAPHAEPFLMLQSAPAINALGREREADMQRAMALAPERSGHSSAAYLLPDEPWSRRVVGTFSNRLANDHPQRAHAVLVPNSKGGYSVSMRSAIAGNISALELCRQFPGGGGRVGAGGIDNLEPRLMDEFMDQFEQAYRSAG